MKAKYLVAALLLLICMALLAAPGCANVLLDGRVDDSEWWGAEVTSVRRDVLAGHCDITEAYVRHEANEADGTVTFGFAAKCPGCTGASAIGTAFLVGGQVFAAWRQDIGGSIDTSNYSIVGAAWVSEAGPVEEESPDTYYSYEIAVRCKNSACYPAFFQLFRGLELQLYDAGGVVSKAFGYPLMLEQAETTEPAARQETTAKEITTKVTTTKVTTTKVTTTKITTTKITTTKVTTTKAATTTKAPAITTTAAAKKTQAAVTLAPYVWTGVKKAAKTAAAPAPPPTQPAEQKTEIIWYTAPVTAESRTTEPPGIDGALLAYQTEESQAIPGEEAAPVFLETPETPVSLRTPLLLGTAGFLLALAMLLVLLWLKGQGYMQKEPASETQDEDEALEN